MTTDELAAKLDEQFARIDQKFESIDQRFEQIDARFVALENKVDQGFNDSKTRDENLRDLMTFGLEAREVLRDEMRRRFYEADLKHDQQLALLKDTVRHLTSHK